MLTLLVHVHTGTHWYMQEYIHVQYTSNVKAASHLYLPCTHEPIASALCDMRCNPVWASSHSRAIFSSVYSGL